MFYQLEHNGTKSRFDSLIMKAQSQIRDLDKWLENFEALTSKNET